MLVHPAKTVSGTIRVPGDKSISHRVAMLAGLASGISTVSGFLASEDCLNTLAAVEALGASVARDGSALRIKGTNGRFHPPHETLDVGNSGTGMRLLAGLLAGHAFTSEMTGDASLRSRPMARIQEPLERMGATVELLGEGKAAPLRITGGTLKGIRYELPVASAQVKSCVLLAGLLAEGKTEVIEPKPTRDHTERLLKAMGVPVQVDGPRISLDGSGSEPPLLSAEPLHVPGDFSSAAFWIAAAACREGSEITIEHVGLNPRRTAFLGVLERMGAQVRKTEDERQRADWEPVGTIAVTGTRLRGIEVGGEEIPNLIDELPLIAVLGALADGTTIIRNAAELRVKESDRIVTMATNMRALGVYVEETPDGMIIQGGAPVQGRVAVDSFGDHRVAMATSVLALSADAPVTVNRVACVATSYPDFQDSLATLAKDNTD
jgi:3-phosphoshikimate 1-carboxyvinyltransferase